ncbi:TonB-dependent receptor [Flavobacterium luteum]|uniref:TonB-dependent receptor plug domain-containing protein n=1 Tax=Flavobacterium luteum TaxID=2026654 RepID=A0A7J5AGR1_9FLAO|nr:TonB-dependent receptor [Flavobacterium luteum]KAB1156774.1 TonB-dependent receptor plug domain-containing protein [Flavobacterium luteum]
MKKSTLFMKRLGLIVAVLLVNLSFSQNATLSGVISDAKGNPIPGVNVNIQNTTKTTATDADGKYVVSNLQNGEVVVVASYIGYKTVSTTVTISGNTVQNIAMTEDANVLDDVVVTGVVNPKSRLESSVSVSSIGTKQIEQSAPRTTGEVFRNIPGVRAESSGGEGNANFNVRGVPVSAGGSRYLQLQEDGLPVMLFGDTSFGNSDNWLRIDSNIGRVESIRGGSASTQTSNGPAGIINMISKTGKTESGSVATTVGVDFNTNRLDFEYGTPLANGISYHLGGFVRSGEGPRAVGYNASQGGQFKANITKEFKSGYVRTSFKFLNDKTPMYMPMPMLLQGTDSNPTYANLPGFDITTDGLQSKYLQESTSPTSSESNNPTRDVRNGNNPISKSIGLEAEFDLGEGWKLSEKGRMSFNKGNWIAPFTAGVYTTSGFIAGINQPTIPAGSSLTYADDGSPFAPSNGLIQNIHMFDTTQDNLNNLFNDIKITKKLGDNISVTAGYFTASQTTKISWQWNAYLQEVRGGGDARLVNVDGLSRNGQWSYGTPVWGNCCQRNYNVQHTVNAPYAAVDANITEKLNFSGSIRYDNVNVDGTISAGNIVGPVDVNGNTTIETIETLVPVVQATNRNFVADNYGYTSYSAGLNYKLNDNSAVFGRYSLGASGRAADRNGYRPDGTARDQFDQVSQLEAGYKRKFSSGYLNATVFHSITDEAAGTALNLNAGNKYNASGLELEGLYNAGDFSVVGSLTYTKAKIIEDRTSGVVGTNNGKTPQRQADFVYNLSPTYVFGKSKQHLVGLSALGTSKSYAFDDNKLVQPGYVYINLLLKAGLTEGLSLSYSVNNLLDTVGITEVNGVDGAYNSDRLVRARSITGRSSMISLQYRF